MENPNALAATFALAYPDGWLIIVQIQEGKTYYGTTSNFPTYSDFLQVAKSGSKMPNGGPGFAKTRSIIRTEMKQNARLTEAINQLHDNLPY